MTPALLLLFVRLKHRDDTSNETYYKQYLSFFFFFLLAQDLCTHVPRAVQRLQSHLGTLHSHMCPGASLTKCLQMR